MAEYNPSKIIKDGNTYNFRDNTKIPLAGSNQISGDLIPATNNAYSLGSSTYEYSAIYASYFKGNGDTTIYQAKDGAYVELSSEDRPTYAGMFHLGAYDGINLCTLRGTPSGTLTWGSKNVAMAEDVVPRAGGAVLTGTRISKTTDTSELSLDGGSGWTHGATITLYGKDNSGTVLMAVNNGTSLKIMYLYPNGTWTWQGQAVQLVSDQRLKQQISEIDNNLLDAWEDVTPVQFKYNDAVNEKGDNARLHTGYVVQQIDSACKSHGVDISQYGLFCHEEYPQEVEEVEVKQADGTKTKERKVIREASEHYSLRYTEALIVECKYLRRCIARLTARIEELEKGNKEIEK